LVLVGRAVGEDRRVTANTNARTTTTAPTTTSVRLLNSGRLTRRLARLINMVAHTLWFLKMGTEANPSDIKRGRRRVIDELAKDLDPASREAVTRASEDLRGDESEEELRRILGKRPGRRPARVMKA
jgi:hypothetical protein